MLYGTPLPFFYLGQKVIAVMEVGRRQRVRKMNGKLFTRERRADNASDALEERAEAERIRQLLNSEQFDDDD